MHRPQLPGIGGPRHVDDVPLALRQTSLPLRLRRSHEGPALTYTEGGRTKTT